MRTFLFVFCYLLTETKTSHGRPQIQLSTMITVARMLACSCVHNQSSREADIEHPHADAKRRFGPGILCARKSSPALYLLSYLITCLSHITHSVCPEFNVPKLPPLDIVVDICTRLDCTDLWHGIVAGDSSKAGTSSGLDTGRRKRSRWEPATSDDTSGLKSHSENSGSLMNKTNMIGVIAASLLSDSRWPSDVSSNAKVSFLCFFVVKSFIAAIACLCTCVYTRLFWIGYMYMKPVIKWNGFYRNLIEIGFVSRIIIWPADWMT